MNARFMSLEAQRRSIIKSNAENALLLSSASQFFNQTVKAQYSYSFDWLGRPIIQYPQDIVAFQEILYSVKPDLIIETGIAHGGSLVLSASILCLLDLMAGRDPRESPSKVVGVDVDIRPHNRDALDAHPLRFKMELIEGSSIDEAVIRKVHSFVSSDSNVLVSLDSSHTHDHVVAELDAYAVLTSVGSYCIVFDTVIEDLPKGSFPNRDWDIGNNPKTAVHQWLGSHPEFQIDHAIDQKLLISVAPDGYLKRVA